MLPTHISCDLIEMPFLNDSLDKIDLKKIKFILNIRVQTRQFP